MVSCICELHVFDGEGAAGIGQAFAHAGHAECLAGRAADQHVGRRDLAGQHQGGQSGHVAEVRRVGAVVRQDRRGKRLDLGEPGGAHAQRVPGLCGGFDAAAHRAVGDVRHRGSSPAGVIRRSGVFVNGVTPISQGARNDD